MAYDPDMQAVYDVANKNGWLANDPDFQQVSHLLRGHGWVKPDPTQGGVMQKVQSSPLLDGVSEGTPIIHPFGMPGQNLQQQQAEQSKQVQLQSAGEPFLTVDPTGYTVMHGGKSGKDRYYNDKGHEIDKSHYVKAVTGASSGGQAQSFDSSGNVISKSIIGTQAQGYDNAGNPIPGSDVDKRIKAKSNPLNQEFWDDVKSEAGSTAEGLSKAAGDFAGHIDLGHYQKSPDTFTKWLQTHDKWMPKGGQSFVEGANTFAHNPAKTLARSDTGAVAGMMPLALGVGQGVADAGKIIYHGVAGNVDAARGDVQGDISHSGLLNKSIYDAQTHISDLAGGQAGSISKLSRATYYAAHPDTEFAGGIKGKDLALSTVQNVINNAGEQLWRDPAQFTMNGMMLLHGSVSLGKPIAEMSYSRAAQHWRNVQIDAAKSGDATGAALAGARAATYEGTVMSMRKARGADAKPPQNKVAAAARAVNHLPDALLNGSYEKMLEARTAGEQHFAQFVPKPLPETSVTDNGFETSDLGGPVPIDPHSSGAAMSPEMKMLIANGRSGMSIAELMPQVMRMTPEEMTGRTYDGGDLGAGDLSQAPIDALRAKVSALPAEPLPPDEHGALGGPVGEPRPLPEPTDNLSHPAQAPGGADTEVPETPEQIVARHTAELAAVPPDVAQQHPALVSNLADHHTAEIDALKTEEPSASKTARMDADQERMPTTEYVKLADKSLQKAANGYNKEHGLPRMSAGRPWEEVDPRAHDIADAYDAMEHKPNAAAVRKSYGALKREIEKQYNYAVRKMGITFEAWDKPGQPYANSSEMTKDVRDNKHLYFFRGGDMPADHPLALVNKKTGLTYNDMLRGVHDLFGHAVNGYGFGPRGEENAWIKHSQMFSQDARGALTTETKGQNSWVNFGAHLRDENGRVPKPGKKGHVPPPDRPFAEQKAGLLPEQYHSRLKGTDNGTSVPGRQRGGSDTRSSSTAPGAREPVSSSASAERSAASGPDAAATDAGSDTAATRETASESNATRSAKPDAAAELDEHDTGSSDTKHREEGDATKDTSAIDYKNETWEQKTKRWRDTFNEVLKDETGSGHDAAAYIEALTRGVEAAKGSPAGELAARIITNAVNALSPRTWVPREGLDTIGEMRGEQEHKIWRVEQLFHESRKLFDSMSNDDLIAFIDAQKSGGKHQSPELQFIGDMYRKLEDDLHSQLQESKPDAAYLENHFRVFWKKIPGKDAAKSGLNVLGRRPLQGSKGFLKQHTLETIAEGIKLGGEPVTYNPQKLFEMNYADTMKYITAQRMMKSLKAQGLAKFVRTGSEPPENFVKLNDRIAEVYYRHMIQQLHATPETIYQMSDKLRGDLNAPEQGAAALSLERRDVPGPIVKAGDIYVEHNTGRLLNNYLSRDIIRESDIGKGALWIKNATTALELSFSAFHAIAESLEAGGSEFGLGLKKILDGDIKSGAANIGRGLVPIVAAWDTARAGGSAIQYARNAEEFLKTNRGQSFIKTFPDAGRLVQDLFNGGAKLTMHQDYRLNSIDAFKEARKDAKSGNVTGYLRAAMQAIPATIEYTMRPLFEYYIPRLKVGMFLKEYSYLAEQKSHLLGEAPDPRTGNVEEPTTTRTELARQTWDRVENRLGEMNFDNIYWDRTFKSALQLAFRSVTWKMGNVRAFTEAHLSQAKEIQAAIKEKRMPELTPGMAWLAGMTVTTAVISGLVQKIATGLNPGEDKDHVWHASDVIKDMIFPKTATDDPKARIATPTMWKDFANLQHDPVEYLHSAQSSDIGAAQEIFNNRDFFHTQIYSEDDPKIVQAWDVFRHIFKLPISFQSFMQSHEQGEPAWKQATTFGVATKVPAWVTRDQLEEFLFQTGLKSPKPTLTREQAAINKIVYNDGKLYDAGKITKEDLRHKVQDHELTVDQVLKIVDSHGKGQLSTGFGRLSIADAIKAWGLASSSEKAALKPQMMMKVSNNSVKLTTEQHNQLKALGLVLR